LRIFRDLVEGRERSASMPAKGFEIAGVGFGLLRAVVVPAGGGVMD